MSDAASIADLPLAPGTRKRRAEKPVPVMVARILDLVQYFMVYGRHLADTLERRAQHRNFCCIAQFFGTANLAVIAARITRGLLRCQALEQVLLARAKRGRELVHHNPLEAKPRPVKTAVVQPKEKLTRFYYLGRPDPNAPPDPDNMPTLEELVREVRRLPIGRTISEICRDLAISPSLCNDAMWDTVFEAIWWYRGKLAHLILELRRREVTYADEADRDRNLGWPEDDNEVMHQSLGFWIGEMPVMPPLLQAESGSVAAEATGPP